MRALYSNAFTKQFEKLRKGEQKRCLDRIRLFLENSRHALLHDHALSGDMQSRRSINIGGDLRALYRKVDEQTVQFLAIDTHTNLYE